VLRAKPDIADQHAEAEAIARGMTVFFQIILISIRLDAGTVMI
jgi:hypothetical protein